MDPETIQLRINEENSRKYKPKSLKYILIFNHPQISLKNLEALINYNFQFSVGELGESLKTENLKSFCEENSEDKHINR